jgi:Fe-S-cluster-containing dehydrogenase component
LSSSSKNEVRKCNICFASFNNADQLACFDTADVEKVNVEDEIEYEMEEIFTITITDITIIELIKKQDKTDEEEEKLEKLLAEWYKSVINEN